MTPQEKTKQSARIKELHDEYYGSKRKNQDKTTATGEYAVPCMEYVNDTDDMRKPKIKAIVARHLKEDLPKNVRLISLTYKETDSGNISHAVAYYDATVEGPASAIAKLVGPDKLLASESNLTHKAEKPGKTEKTSHQDAPGQEIKETPKQEHPVKQGSRKALMEEAARRGIKYFRILTKEELVTVLANEDKGGDVEARKETDQIIDGAKKRWKAGWGKQGKK